MKKVILNKSFLNIVKNYLSLTNIKHNLKFGKYSHEILKIKLKRKKPIEIKEYSSFINDNQDKFKSHNFIFVAKYHQFVSIIKNLAKENSKYAHTENVFPEDSEDIYICTECNHFMIVNNVGYAYLLDSYIYKDSDKAYKRSCSDKIIDEILE